MYKERVLDVAVNCAREASRTGVKRLVQVSTAQVYNSDKVCGIIYIYMANIELGLGEGGQCGDCVPRSSATRAARWSRGRHWPSST